VAKETEKQQLVTFLKKIQFFSTLISEFQGGKSSLTIRRCFLYKEADSGDVNRLRRFKLKMRLPGLEPYDASTILFKTLAVGFTWGAASANPEVFLRPHVPGRWNV